MINSVNFKEFYIIEITLLILTTLFVVILFTKKGLFVENQKLFFSIFLFGFVMKKTLIPTSNFHKLTLAKGKLSTNYAYSYDKDVFHNWEPDLNSSVTSYTLFMFDENQTHKQKIITLTKPEKVKLAINFIAENTKLIISQTSS